MSCDELRSDYLLYAMGTMAESESSELRAHLARGCQTCLSGLREARELVYSIGASVEGPDPPRRLRRRILAIAEKDSAAAGIGIPFWRAGMRAWQGWALASVCLALALIPGVLWLRQSVAWNARQAAAESRLREQEQSVASLREQVAILERATPRAVPIFSLELARGEGNSDEGLKQVSIPPGTSDVVLALPVDLLRQASAVELRNAADETIWKMAPVRVSESESAGVSVPARIVPPGGYVLVLRAGERVAARLTFRVVTGR